ncbi:MAG: transposase, partial [Spirobacillus cienkowskii]
MANCGVKFRAYPTAEQAHTLSQWIGCARVIYNCKVSEDNQNYNIFK